MEEYGDDKVRAEGEVEVEVIVKPAITEANE